MRMAPDSNTVVGPSLSMIVGIFPFGFRARYSGLCWLSVRKSTTSTVYGRPTSSSMMVTLRPFGVVNVYRSIMAVPHGERSHESGAGRNRAPALGDHDAPTPLRPFAP